jgi:tRNA-dihydrouridine synthase
MEGVTNPTMRAAIAEKGGVGIVCTEFVRITRAPLSLPALRREVIKAPGMPLSVQVMGNEPAKMADAAGAVCAAGADVVDINLGCPMPRVVRKGVGAAMLKNPTLLCEVLSAMREQTRAMLSAKIRAGFDDAERVFEIAELVQSAGVDYIVVHPRRREDFYQGVADWRIVARLRRYLSIPVVGNGDVWYAADALRLERETACDAVMIGRPALRNPWIFRQIAQLRSGAAPDRPTGVDLFEHLLGLADRFRREGNPIGRLKEQLRYLGRAVDDDGVYGRSVLRSESLDDMLRISERTLARLTPDRLDLDAHGTLRLERCGSGRIASLRRQ